MYVPHGTMRVLCLAAFACQGTPVQEVFWQLIVVVQRPAVMLLPAHSHLSAVVGTLCVRDVPA